MNVNQDKRVQYLSNWSHENTGSQPAGGDSGLGRGEHSDGSRIYFQNNFIFLLNNRA
jgi:hypothetical protein